MINSIRLQNFRSYKDAAFDFEPAVNIIVGPNASGKTNLLEAILYISQGKSYRAKDSELIKNGKDWARIDAHTQNSVARTAKIQTDKPRSSKQFMIGDKTLKTLNFKNQQPVILFEPNQLQRITSSPEQRRNLLDDLLEQTDQEFSQHKKAYLRVLAQRNSLLKQQKTVVGDQLFVWNLRLSEFAGSIVNKRLALVADLNKTLTVRYQEIAQKKDRIHIDYLSNCRTDQYASSLLKKLEQDLPHDLARGFTGSGPHREDFAIYINKQPIQAVASRGETRTLLLSIKSHEVELIEKTRREKPILLLDDVFSELDGVRRKTLTTILETHQSFITTTDADIVTKNFSQRTNILPLLWHLVDVN